MKTGLTISASAHAAALLWGLVTFSTKPYETAPVDSLPVDIISDSEFSQLTAGSKTAQKIAAPQPLVEKIAPPKVVENPVPKVVERQEVMTEQAVPTPPAPPEPKVVEQPPAPTPPPRPEPKQAETKQEPKKTDQIAEALKKEDAKRPEPKKDATTPAPKPVQAQPKFDANRIAALLDKREPQRQAATGDVVNSTASLGSPLGNAPKLSQSEIDALRAQIQACWNPPAGAADAKDLIVTVRLQLKLDGSLHADPILLNRGGSQFFQIAAESALRAIRRCQPYRLPAAKYQAWKDVEVTFDPRDMYRG